MDDEANTFTFNSTSGTVYEYSLDSGSNWIGITASGATTNVPVGNIAVAVGALQVRATTTATHEAGAILQNTTAFTTGIEGNVTISGTATYGETLTATASGTQSGTVLSYQWKAGGENIGTNSTSLPIPGSAVGKTITVEVTASGYAGKLVSAATAEIGKKAVTATAGSISKTYDGNTKVSLADQTLTIAKVNEGDDITIITVANYDDANIGTNKPITFGFMDIKGTAKDWYEVTAPSNVTGEITAKPVASASVTVGGSYTYTGAAQTPDVANVTVKDGDTTLTYNTDYTYAASNNTNVGTATVTVIFKDNYSGTAIQPLKLPKPPRPSHGAPQPRASPTPALRL